MTDATQPDWDPRAESVLQNQRQAYDKMRQSCPVARSSDGQWTLFRHADVMRVLEDHQSFSNQVSQHISVPNGMDRMRICPRTNTAIRDRLRKECRALWPMRKQHPTLKSFRHQLGSTLKASGESDEAIAYMMGHQSIESISVYGNRRSGAGHKLHIRPTQDADLSKVRQPKQPAVFGRERVVGRIEVPQRLANRRATAQPVANER